MRNKLVTVFGGSGFIGRYAVQALLATGARVRVVSRDPRDAWYLKPQGGLGQAQFLAADVRKPATVTRALAGADAAVNLVGLLRGDLAGVNAAGARNVADAAAREGLTALIHVSALGAAPGSASAYGRSKGEGEAGARTAFPGVTILRPSIVFGPEDHFVNRFAALIRLLPVVPVIRGPVCLQPIYVGDVAKAIVAALADPRGHAGAAYDLGGPEVLTMAALNRRIAAATGRSPAFLEVPDSLAALMARLTGWAPGAPITADQFAMLQANNVVPGESGLAALGIAPTPLEAVAEGWLVQYRRHGRFAGIIAS